MSPVEPWHDVSSVCFCTRSPSQILPPVVDWMLLHPLPRWPEDSWEVSVAFTFVRFHQQQPDFLKTHVRSSKGPDLRRNFVFFFLPSFLCFATDNEFQLHPLVDINLPNVQSFQNPLYFLSMFSCILFIYCLCHCHQGTQFFLKTFVFICAADIDVRVL